MFIKRTEQLTANMPDTVLSPEDQQQASSLSPNTAVAGSKGQPGLAESAGGAAVALAGWAFTSLSSRLGNSDLATPMLERRASTPSGQPSQPGSTPGTSSNANRIGNLAQTSSLQGQQRSASQPNLPGISNGPSTPAGSSARSSLAFGNAGMDDILDADPMAGSGDWGGDLIDVAADDGDFDEFESAQPAPPPAPAEPIVHPRYTITRPAASSSTSAKKPTNGISGKKVSSLGGGANRPTGASKAAASVLKEIEAEEGLAADWSFDGDGDQNGAGAHHDGWGAEEDHSPSTPQTSMTPTLGTSTTSSPANNSNTSSTLAKERLAQMKEERKARLAAAKEKKAAAALGAKKL